MAVDIPNYRVLEKLGVGAQTRLFRARCMRSGRDYTVKIVKIAKPEDSSFIELLRSELAIGSAIDHPTIRKVFELRMIRHRLRVRGAILFMEYVPGISMAEKAFKADLSRVLCLFRTVATGLLAMHEAGYVHADLKPSNILVGEDETVKLIDLGQSAAIDQAKPRIQGTIDYMAPEQVQRKKLDRRTDVFGLGATLHRVLTGRPIATQMNQTVSIHSQGLIGKRNGAVADPADAAMPSVLIRLMSDCCEPDPENRLPHMQAVIERLELARTSMALREAGSDWHQDDEDLDEPIDSPDAWLDEVAPLPSSSHPNLADVAEDFVQGDVGPAEES